MHGDIQHLSALIGTWRGRGSGHYPTIEPFEYLEEAVFGHVGKPFISYAQKTRSPETELPVHAETGYLRPVGTDRIELVLSQPSGVVEIDVGSVTISEQGEVTIDLTSQLVGTTDTAKDVTEVRRTLRVNGNEMAYDMYMAAVGEPLEHHLNATLNKVSE